MLHKIFKGIAPIAALALSAGLAGCDGMNITIGDGDGVKLSELDMSGDAPTKLVLAGPDNVVVSDGDKLDISVEGDSDVTDRLRFKIDDGTLAIMREKGKWSDDNKATVKVTMPSPKDITLAGSGSVDAQSLAGDASVTIAGSGKAAIAAVKAEKLDLTIAGSGTFSGAGSADKLELTIAGSGSVAANDLKVGDAEITVAGSGSAEFASDGKVEAKVMGSGDVKVTGNATCTVKSMGSGTVTCKTTASAGDKAGEAGDDAGD